MTADIDLHGCYGFNRSELNTLLMLLSDQINIWQREFDRGNRDIDGKKLKTAKNLHNILQEERQTMGWSKRSCSVFIKIWDDELEMLRNIIGVQVGNRAKVKTANTELNAYYDIMDDLKRRFQVRII